MSVAQNLVYGAPQDTDLSGDLIDLLGIGALLDRAPRDLSGGEAQRVAIGRALMSDPDILLLDEPLAALDQARRDDILPYLDQLAAMTGIPMIYVSHAMSEVARLADRIVLMRNGRVVRAGEAADILSDPALVPQIGVREAGAVLTATVATQDLGDGLSALQISQAVLYLPKVAAPEGAQMKVRILASDIILSKDRPDGLSALNILPCTVSGIQDGAGPGVAIALQSGEDRLVARITRRSAQALKLAVGLKCFAVIKSVSVAPGNVGRGAAGLERSG
jgi:molybdate transport system ATP-binding protein